MKARRLRGQVFLAEGKLAEAENEAVLTAMPPSVVIWK